MTLIVDETIYIAPRILDRPAEGRVEARADCGHQVWLSPRGVEATTVDGKQLACLQCIEAAIKLADANGIIVVVPRED